MSGSRGDFFNALKSICVPILKLSTQPPIPAVSQELIRQLDSLLESLDAHKSVLDEGLANYVFLPLSHVFRQQAHHPARLVELSVAILAVLIDKGWKSGLIPDHLNQLFILLVFILDPKSKPKSKPSPTASDPNLALAPKQSPRLPEELRLQALNCLSVLFRAVHSSPSASSSLETPSMIPSLGHGIVVVLDLTVAQPLPSVQLGALDALDAIYSAIRGHETLANFFPGTISCLAKILSPPLSSSQKSKVLVRSLRTFQSITIRVLGDMYTRHLLYDAGEPAGYGLDSSWLKTTSTHLGLALSSVTKLRSHASEDVRQELRHMCIAFLDECHHSLRPCSTMLAETAMGLQDAEAPARDTGLEYLASIYPEIGDDIKSVVYAWMSSAPRVMQQQLDDHRRERELQNLFSGIRLLHSLNLDTPTLIETFSVTLKDVVATMIRSAKPNLSVNEVVLSREQWVGNSLVDTTSQFLDFKSPILEHEGVQGTRAKLVSLLGEAAARRHGNLLVGKLFALLQESDGDDRVSSYWLALEILRSDYPLQLVDHGAAPPEIDALFDLASVSDERGNASAAMLQELYQYSLDTINQLSDTLAENEDQRVVAIALEVIALTSTRLGRNFRPELMDVLYPVATLLGSRSQQLQSHAIVTLETIAASCRYSNVADLIVANVDYMLNTAALKLNSLDISPATTQVLRMMARLSGPRLVPFMEDVVDAIFGALENYHGYPALVDGLFSVLAEVARQGSGAGEALLSNPSQTCAGHRKLEPTWTTIQEISAILAKGRKRRQGEEDQDEKLKVDGRRPGGHPLEPWKGWADEEGEKGPDPGYKEDDYKTPTSSYALLCRIATLTQHYLTSPSPQLRRSLLELVASVVPALATNEKEFLPLVNALWPVIIERLWDPEPYVAATACETLAALCESAGDFLASRFRTEWRQNFHNWLHRSRHGDFVQVGKKPGGLRPWKHSNRSRSVTGRETSMVSNNGSDRTTHSPYSQAAQRWEASKKLLVAVLLYVGVDDDMFDDICWLLADDLEGNEKIREALEGQNGDAVWLARYSQELVDIVRPPRRVVGGPDYVLVKFGVGEGT